MVGALVNHDDAVNDRTPKGKLDTSANETAQLWRQVACANVLPLPHVLMSCVKHASLSVLGPVEALASLTDQHSWTTCTH